MFFCEVLKRVTIWRRFLMRRTHFSKLSSYSSKNRKLVRGMSELTVCEIKLIYYCFGYWLLQLFWAIVVVFCLLLEWNIYGRFSFFFWCCFFQVTKDTCSWNGFYRQQITTLLVFSETILGKLGTCFSFFFRFRLFLFFIVKKQNATKKTPSILIVLPSGASPPFP